MKTSLANKYRPKTFEEVCSQESIVESLNKQVETGTFGNAYLLVGKTGCVDKDTEFFTGSGWKKISEYQEGDLVLQYNPETGAGELVKPLDYIKTSCDEFNHFHTKYGIDMLVCDEHTMVYDVNNHICTKLAKDVVNIQNSVGFEGHFLTTFKFSGKGVDVLTDNEIRFMWKHICDVFEEDRESIKYVVDYWYDCNQHQLQVIVDSILKWTGASNGRCQLSHVDKNLIDFVQFAFTSCGYKAKCVRYGKYYGVSVSLKHNSKISLGKSKVVREKSLDGFKYCFTVPTHMWIMRRNGCIVVTGNCGKTTTARILGNSINKGLGEPIEIDAASNNSAEAMRELVKNANQRSIDSEYKIIIIDEAHLLSSAAWNVLLKTLEEPPKYTIFILCTTEEKKVPATIVNRTLCYHISAIPSNIINDRLCYIAESEGFTNYKQSCEYISKNSDNSLRQAIANLEKVSYLGKDFSLKQTLRCLGGFSYNDLFDLTDALLDNNNDIEQIKTIIRVVEDIYLQGKDLKQFVHDYTVFILDIIKYVTFKSFDLISIPESMIEDIHAITGNENSACLPIYRRISENLFTLSLIMNNTKDLKNTLELNLLKIKGGKDLCL